MDTWVTPCPEILRGYEIITSWEKEGANKALEKVALNSLREGLSVDMVVKITDLTVERVQELKAKLKAEDNK